MYDATWTMRRGYDCSIDMTVGDVVRAKKNRTLGLILCKFGPLESTPISHRHQSFNESLTPIEMPL